MSKTIGRYRKLYPRLWRHPGFRGLNKGARELALYLLTGPQTSRIGIFHFSIATAAEDLSAGVETLRERMRDVTTTFGWYFDADARVFWIPSWWTWNVPENANVLVGNLKDLSEIPGCALVEAFARNLETLPETFHQTFVERCARRLAECPPIQEQKQGTRSEARTEAGRASREASNGKNPELLKIAREAIRYSSPDDLELLHDTFQSLYRDKHKENCARADALLALNVAISERRTGNAAH